MGMVLQKPRVIERGSEFLSIADRAPDSLMRRLDEAVAAVSNPLNGFPLGKMKLRGELGKNGQAKFDAAAWFWKLTHEYRAAIEAKGIAPQSMERGSKGEPPDVFSVAGENRTRREKRVIREYTSAKLSGLACGAENYAYFLAVVIEEQEPNYTMKQAVAQVSEALRRHRQLASRQRQGRRS